MKYTILFILLFPFLFAQSQEISILKGGRISFEGKTINKPSEMEMIFLQKESSEILENFSKYKSNRGASQVFGFLGGLGLGYSLSNLFIQDQRVNGGILAGGIGLSAIGILLNSTANKKLKKAIELYNSQGTPKVSFEPYSNTNFGVRSLGIQVKF